MKKYWTSVAATGQGPAVLMNLVAIDFETADNGRDSACAIGMVRVLNGAVVAQQAWLIRPPRRDIYYTHIHGLSWEDVCDAPDFAACWPEIHDFIGDADFLAAHNAGFDRGVMNGCCDAAGITPPDLPWICTVKLARRAWKVRPTKLPDVCRHLVISLNHHDAASDAHACAQIIVSALEDGFHVEQSVLGS
jgi:DNA polymerase III subunit epsilon